MLTTPSHTDHGTRRLVVLGDLVQTTTGRWITHLPTHAAAADTPPGPAAHAMRRSTGHRSTRTARASTGRRLVPAHPDVAGPHDGIARHRQSGDRWLTGWRANPNHCPPSLQTRLITGRLLALGSALARPTIGVCGVPTAPRCGSHGDAPRRAIALRRPFRARR